MKQYLPNTDNDRARMCRQVITQAAADLAAGTPYLSQSTVDTVTAFLPGLDSAIEQRNEAIQARIVAVEVAAAAKKRLDQTIRGIWHETNRRVNHEGKPASLRQFYLLPLNGRFPKITSSGIYGLAQQIIAGDADAVAAGYSATLAPSAAELQAAHQAAWDTAMAKMQAKADVSDRQSALAVLRAQADDLCRLVRDELDFVLRDLPPSRVRPIKEKYGIQFVADADTEGEAEPIIEPAAA